MTTTNGKNYLVTFQTNGIFDSVQVTAVDEPSAQAEFYRRYPKGLVTKVTPRHPAAPADGKLNVKRSEGMIQATRTEPAKKVNQWIVSSPVGPVAVMNIEEARKFAATFGCEIIL